MADEKLNLIQKLAQVGMEISYVEKSGENKSKDGKINYKYVKAADVAKEIRQKLFSRNVILTIDEKEITTQGIVKTYSGGELPLICVKSDFTFHDGDSDAKLTLSAYGIAMDSGDKAIYKAKTGALKYVLRGIALIPDEKDDPEHDIDPEHVTDKIQHHVNEFEAREGKQPIAPFKVNALWDACKATGKSHAEIMEFLGSVGYVQFEEVTNADFEAIRKWCATRPEVPQDLVPALKRSVDMAKAQKGSCASCGSKLLPSKFKEGQTYCSNKDCETRKPKRAREEQDYQPVDA